MWSVIAQLIRGSAHQQGETTYHVESVKIRCGGIKMKWVFIDLGSKEYEESEVNKRQLNLELSELELFRSQNESSKYAIVSVIPFPYL